MITNQEKSPCLKDLYSFAAGFEKSIWEKLCENKNFLDLIDSNNLGAASELSKKLLTKENESNKV